MLSTKENVLIVAFVFSVLFNVIGVVLQETTKGDRNALGKRTSCPDENDQSCKDRLYAGLAMTAIGSLGFIVSVIVLIVHLYKRRKEEKLAALDAQNISSSQE